MSILLQRRNIMTQDNLWEMMIHNSFDKYTYSQGSGGNVFEIMDGGEWVRVVSNGNNKNTSAFYNSYRYVYDDIKDKICRMTWHIECSDPEAFDASTGTGNISFGLYQNQVQTSGNLSQRKTKGTPDFADVNTFLGYHSVEFIPSDYFSTQGANYFGWNIGFRSSVNGLTIRILQLDFEVHK